eukprot:m.15815 g.15815  ORF g.15815 m.15815 type:complete len:144 (-) comp5494_c0_seq2:1052-1483(-)
MSVMTGSMENVLISLRAKQQSLKSLCALIAKKGINQPRPKNQQRKGGEDNEHITIHSTVSFCFIRPVLLTRSCINMLLHELYKNFMPVNIYGSYAMQPFIFIFPLLDFQLLLNQTFCCKLSFRLPSVLRISLSTFAALSLSGH